MGNDTASNCPKRDRGLITTVLLLKQQSDDTRYCLLARECASCQHPDATKGRCSELVRHMDGIRDHLKAIEDILGAGAVVGR